jgi:flagellin
MSVVINTNTQSLFAQRALRGNTNMMKSSIEKLSTGFRINRAGDDAAGLSISEKMTAQIRGTDQAKRNIGDGISLLQTAEGALGVVQDNLQRIRELTVQAENGTNSNDELDAIQREINERVTAIEDMGNNAEFNGTTLLDGGADIDLQIGANDGETLTLELQSGGTQEGVHIEVDGTTLGGLGEDAIELNSFHVGGSGQVKSGNGSSTANGDLDDLDTMINNVSRMRSQLGAYQNSLDSNLNYLDNYSENLQGARSRIKDVDVAEESGKFVKSQILQQTATAMLSQANSVPQTALNLLP